MKPALVRRPSLFQGVETAPRVGHDALSTMFVPRAFLFFVMSTPEAQVVGGRRGVVGGETPAKRQITRRC